VPASFYEPGLATWPTAAAWLPGSQFSSNEKTEVISKHALQIRSPMPRYSYLPACDKMTLCIELDPLSGQPIFDYQFLHQQQVIATAQPEIILWWLFYVAL